MPQTSQDELNINIEDFEQITDNSTEGSDLEAHVPLMCDPEWTDYVLSLLTDNEKMNDKPKASGLLRIAPLVYSDIKCVHPPSVYNLTEQSAAVSIKIDFDNGTSFTGSAEVSPLNCNKPFVDFPLSSASTRALGRALKTAYRLQVLTAEEGNDISSNYSYAEEKSGDSVISETQIGFLAIMCGPKKLNINLLEAVSHITGKKVESPKTLTHADALNIQEVLNNWYGDVNQIPENISEYNDEWRTN